MNGKDIDEIELIEFGTKRDSIYERQRKAYIEEEMGNETLRN